MEIQKQDVPFYFIYFILVLKIFYLFIHERHREREREAETQAEGEAGSMQGARHETRSQVSRIAPWAEGGAKPLSHPDCPGCSILFYFILFYFILFYFILFYFILFYFIFIYLFIYSGDLFKTQIWSYCNHMISIGLIIQDPDWPDSNDLFGFTSYEALSNSVLQLHCPFSFSNTQRLCPCFSCSTWKTLPFFFFKYFIY